MLKWWTDKRIRKLKSEIAGLKASRMSARFILSYKEKLEKENRQLKVDFAHLYTAFEAAVKSARLNELQKEMLLMAEKTGSDR